jgi:chloride channel protein, CIC family
VGEDGALVGVVTRRDLVGGDDSGLLVRTVMKRLPAVIYADSSLREAADHMVRERVGRLVVVERGAPTRITGIITRSDLLSAHERRLHARDRPERAFGKAS